MFEKLSGRLTNILLALAAVLIFFLSFLVVADVFGRALFNSPVKGTPEMVSMSIVIICFLLASYSVQSRSMIYTDAVVSMFGDRGHHFATVLSGLLGVALFGLITWGGFEPAIYAWLNGEYEGEGALRVPVWPAKFVVMVGAALVVVIYMRQVVQAGLALFRRVPGK